MTNLIIFKTDADAAAGEESEVIAWGDAPKLGDDVCMGGGWKYAVRRVEAYRNNGDRIAYVAHVDRIDAAQSGESLEFPPGTTFYVNITPDRKIINWGWDLQGKPPGGAIAAYDLDGDGVIKAVPTNWAIDDVDEFLPEQQGEFAAIHICQCREVVAA